MYGAFARLILSLLNPQAPEERRAGKEIQTSKERKTTDTSTIEAVAIGSSSACSKENKDGLQLLIIRGARRLGCWILLRAEEALFVHRMQSSPNRAMQVCDAICFALQRTMRIARFQGFRWDQNQRFVQCDLHHRKSPLRCDASSLRFALSLGKPPAM